MSKTCRLAYGKGFLYVDLDDAHFDVVTIMPNSAEAAGNPQTLFVEKASAPTGSLPLGELGAAQKVTSPKITIVIADHTRPVPDRLLIPWIVSALKCDDRQVTLLVGTGTHRSPNDEELIRMLGEENLSRFRVVVHDCLDSAALKQVGTSKCGGACFLNRHYCEADIRIATGFVEPHFFAGFSGGAKAIVPGIAGMETIRHFHRAELIADPNVTWGITAGNPLLSLAREMVSFCPPDAIVNVSLGPSKQITDVFVGDFVQAHEAACKRVSKESLIPVSRRFPVVLTSNSGYPLDMNFYQTVKGISAAARIAEEGGAIVIVSECRQGIPVGSAFGRMLARPVPPDELLKRIMASRQTAYDQWQVQALLQIESRHRLYLYSALDPLSSRLTRAARVEGVGEQLEFIRRSLGYERLPVAVMPYGPLAIPCVTP